VTAEAALVQIFREKELINIAADFFRRHSRYVICAAFMILTVY
jgi:hypothetical protein